MDEMARNLEFGSTEEAAAEQLEQAAEEMAQDDRTARYRMREDLRDLAARLVTKYPGRLGEVFPTEIAFVVDEESKPRSKGKPMYSRTQRLSALNEFLAGGYTHVVCFFTQNTEHLSNRQLTLLLYHELLHIGEEGKLQGHDVEEFGEVIDTFGRGVLDYRNERLPDILDEGFEWRLGKPTLFDKSSSEAQ
jgi:hypothetical protein